MISTLLLLAALSAEPAYGTTVEAIFEAQGLTVTLPGRLIPCSRNKRCVQLSNGRRAQGRLDGDRFIIEEAP